MLSPEEEERLYRLLVDEDTYQAGRKLWTYYPDEGPLRRELYAKHIEFFAAGVKYNERAALAANRVGKCITIDSRIETPDGELTVSELMDRGPGLVWAWDGNKRVAAMATRPFRKAGLHECYRLTFADGRSLECADHHRILCVDGWRRLSELLKQFAPDLPASSLDTCQSIPPEGDRHCSGIAPDCQGDCSGDCRRGGERPLSVRDSGLASPPSQGDARQHGAVSCGSDGQGNRYTNSPQEGGALLSSQDGPLLPVGRFSGSSIPVVSPIDRRRLGQSLEAPQRFAGSSVLLPQGGEPRQQSRGWSLQAFEAVLSVAGNRIISCVPVGAKPVYDLTVDGLHNYIAGGIVHHNTEGLGAFEVTLHLTGLYPDWWLGRRWDRPINCLAGGDTATTTRDILVAKLLGPREARGTGMIPREVLGKPVPAPGIRDHVDFVKVKHTSGGFSTLQFRSYDQGREAWQGTERDIVWMDEEPPEAVYTEGLLRTMTTRGMVICTFTPLNGLTDVALSFMPELAGAA